MINSKLWAGIGSFFGVCLVLVSLLTTSCTEEESRPNENPDLNNETEESEVESIVSTFFRPFVHISKAIDDSTAISVVVKVADGWGFDIIDSSSKDTIISGVSYYLNTLNVRFKKGNHEPQDSVMTFEFNVSYRDTGLISTNVFRGDSLAGNMLNEQINRKMTPKSDTYLAHANIRRPEPNKPKFELFLIYSVFDHGKQRSGYQGLNLSHSENGTDSAEVSFKKSASLNKKLFFMPPVERITLASNPSSSDFLEINTLLGNSMVTGGGIKLKYIHSGAMDSVDVELK